MPQRRQFVASLPTESSGPKKPLHRIPADLDAIKRPATGQRWYQDAVVVPLRLRVSRRGLSWVFHGRTSAGPRRINLGRYPNLGLDEARTAAQSQTIEATPAGVPLTFAQLRIQYFKSAEFQALAPRTQTSYKWILKGKDYEGLAARKVRSITRLDLLAIKDRIAADGRTFQNYLRPVQALLSWALDRGFIEASPAMRLKLPSNQADPHPYTDSEMGDMILAARSAPAPFSTLYLLVAHTGQRPSTWTDAKWAEVKFKTATFTVSRARGRQSKLKRGWAIPLSAQVVALLQALQKAQGRHRNEWLFGQPLKVESKVRNRIAKAAGLNKASNRGTMHRFRSTMLTKMNEWRVPSETQQRMAGHANPFEGVRGHYIPASPTKEMQEVAERYSEWVEYCALL